MKNGLCVIPWFSFVKNIGFDDSGVHCRNLDSVIELERINENGIFTGIDNLIEDKSALLLLKKSNNRSFIKTVLIKILINLLGYNLLYYAKSFYKKYKDKI